MLGKILIVLLLLTSLIPSLSLTGNELRYLAAFDVLLLTALYALFCLRDKETRRHLLVYYKNNKYVILVMSLYITAIWASSYKTGLNDNIAFVSGISFVLIVLHFLVPAFIKTREDFLLIPKALFLIGLFNAIIVLQFFISYKLRNTGYGIYQAAEDLSSRFLISPDIRWPRLKGIFDNPNSLGMLMAITFPAGLLLVMEARKIWIKVMLIPCLLLLLFALISSLARASILAMLVALVLFIIARIRIIFNTVRILIGAFISGIILIIVSGAKLAYLNSFKALSSGRIELWDRSMPVIHDNMAYGIGVPNIAKLFSMASHNTFIEIALGFGIFALIAYSIYLILSVLMIILHKDRNLSIYMLMVFGSFFVLQFFETLQFGGMSIANFYFLISLVSYLSIISSYKNTPAIENNKI